MLHNEQLNLWRGSVSVSLGRGDVITLSRPDRPGIVCGVQLPGPGSQQRGQSPYGGRFFMKVHSTMPPPGAELAALVFCGGSHIVDPRDRLVAKAPPTPRSWRR